MMVITMRIALIHPDDMLALITENIIDDISCDVLFLSENKLEKGKVIEVQEESIKREIIKLYLEYPEKFLKGKKDLSKEHI